MNGKVILIVEDDRDIRDLLADFLKREGFAVEVAEDGASADRILARMEKYRCRRCDQICLTHFKFVGSQ